MKGTDLLLIGGIGVIAFILLPKQKTTDNTSGPTQIIPEFKFSEIKFPEFKFPEFKFPEIKFPEFEFPEFKFPDIPEIKFPDIPEWVDLVIPDLPDLPDLPSIPDVITENPFVKAFNSAKDIFINTTPDFIRELVTRPSGNWYENWVEIRAETEATFDEAGFSEITSENLPIFIAAKEKVTGKQIDDHPAIGSPEYNSFMLGGTR